MTDFIAFLLLLTVWFIIFLKYADVITFPPKLPQCTPVDTDKVLLLES